MKIAIISYGVLPVPAVSGGAVETLIQQIIDENENKKKLDIIVYSIFNQESLNISQKYRYTKYKYIKINKFIDKFYYFYYRAIRKVFKIEINKEWFYLKKVIKDLKKNNYDKIVIENNSNFVNKVYNETNSPIYLHLHNDYLNDNVNKSEEIFKKCKKIITVSEYIKSRVETIKHEKNKVVTLKNCVDINKFNKDKYLSYHNKIRSNLGIKDNDIVIMYSGRITETKGIKELLLALKKVKSENKFKLLIVGSAWYGKNIKDEYLCKIEEISKDIKDKIVFTGYINHRDMPIIHSISDIAVVPSIWDEPAGLVVIEAMASGIPIIATNSGGIPEYINNDGTIIVNRDNDMENNIAKNLEYLMKNGDKRLHMSKINREYSKKFNIEDYYINFYNILLEE